MQNLENANNGKALLARPLVAAVVCFVLAFGAAFFLADRDRSTQLEESFKQGQSLADHLALIAAKPLENGELDSLKHFAQNHHSLSSRIISVLFFEKKNSQIIAGKAPDRKAFSNIEPKSFTSKIFASNNKSVEIGQVEVLMDISDIGQTFTNNLLIYGSVLFVILFGVIFVSRSTNSQPQADDLATQPNQAKISDDITEEQTVLFDAPPAEEPSKPKEPEIDQTVNLEAPSEEENTQTQSPDIETETPAAAKSQPIPPPASSPKAKSDIELELDAAEAEGDSSEATILIVDDDRANRMVLKRSLQTEYRLFEAVDGEECLNMLEQHHIDLVLLDLMMPGLSGFDVLRHAQENPDKNYPKFIVLSALMDSKTISSVLKLGAVDYLTKPFNIEEMLARINTQIVLDKRELALEKIVSKRTSQLQATNKRLEATFQQLLQSEKMASIGQLAAGVAHEINNPVGFIYSNLSSLGEYLNDIQSLIEMYQQLEKQVKEDPSEAQAQIEAIKKKSNEIDIDYILNDIPDLLKDTVEGTERVKNIVLNLKHFSRADDNSFEFADINDGLESTLKVVWNELKYKCDVNKDFAELPLIKCNMNQLNQVFTNLLVNAAQAIEKHGQINITTRHVDDNVQIIVSDTGKGIDKENLSKLFEPFFTTKPVGQGTGLGLYLSYEIIMKHAGKIEVESEKDKGTTFTITLPVGSK